MSETSENETPLIIGKREASLPTTSINFQGLDGNPIEGLKVRLTVNGQVQEHTTDARGCTPPLRVEPGTAVEIDVQRMDGSCKRIDKDLTSSSDSTWTLSSPAYVLEATTELHQGSPGDAESKIPVWTPSDLGVLEDGTPPVSEVYREEGRNHPVSKQEKPVKPKQVQTKKLPDSARATPIKTGSQAPLQSGRDANGKPMDMAYFTTLFNTYLTEEKAKEKIQ